MYMTMIKKEFLEVIRTKKVLIIVVLFTFFGFLSPITAKIMPDMMKDLLPELANTIIPKATYIDSWGQYFKNISQMGLIVMVIMFAGIVINEISKGTLINLLTKGLKRNVVIVSKSIVMLVIFSVGIILSMVVTAFYNYVLFDNIISFNDIYAVMLLIVFFVLIISLIMFISAFAKNSYTVLMYIALFIGILLFINVIPNVSDYNPISLLVCNLDIISGSISIADTLGSVSVTLILSAALFISSIRMFNKREL